MRKSTVVALTLAGFLSSTMNTPVEARGRGAAVAAGIFGVVLGAMAVQAAQAQAQAQAAAQARARAKAKAQARAEVKTKARAQAQINARRALVGQDTYGQAINEVSSPRTRSGPAREINPVGYMEGKW